MAENDSHAVLSELRDIVKDASGRHAAHLAAVEQRQAETQKRMEDMVHAYRRIVMYFALGVIGIIALSVIAVLAYLL